MKLILDKNLISVMDQNLRMKLTANLNKQMNKPQHRKISLLNDASVDVKLINIYTVLRDQLNSTDI